MTTKNMMRLFTKVWFVVVLVFISLLFLELTPIDMLIQDHFFNLVTHKWLVDKNDLLPKLFFYDGIKKVYIVFAIGILISLLLFKRNTFIKKYRKGLLIVLLSLILIPVFIGFLKSITNVPCPKDLQYYGGSYPYVTLFSQFPEAFHQTKQLKCYPAGHASGGFALMSLFFLFFSIRAKVTGLLIGISLGWLTGGYKMLIGDHFFSHTFMTMLIAWLFILLISRGINRISEYKPNPKKTIRTDHSFDN